MARLYATIVNNLPNGAVLKINDEAIPAPGSGIGMLVTASANYNVTVSSPYATMDPINADTQQSNYIDSSSAEFMWTVNTTNFGMSISIPASANVCYIVVDFAGAYTYDTHTVSFNANGGTTPVPASMSVQNGSPYGTLPTTTKSN